MAKYKKYKKECEREGCNNIFERSGKIDSPPKYCCAACAYAERSGKEKPKDIIQEHPEQEIASGPHVWSNKEIWIIERTGHYSVKSVQRRLEKYGFSRTLTAIEEKRTQLRVCLDREGISANELAFRVKPSQDEDRKTGEE